MILIIDNYDSFTYNLVHAVAAAGGTPKVVRNDAITADQVAALEPDGIVLSPGPGHPGRDADFGVCKDLILAGIEVPMLGVCLGMQGMALHTGGEVGPAPEIVHGEATTVDIIAHPLFAGIQGPVQVGRYHSLAVVPDTLPSAWRILSATQDGTPMAMAHDSLPWVGLQFHPESILSPEGPKMVQNFVGSTR